MFNRAEGWATQRLTGFAVLLASHMAFAQSVGTVPAHVRDAQQLLAQLDLSRTSYAHGPGHVQWQAPVAVVADCSGFADELLAHSYGYSAADLAHWFGSKRPTAKRYFDVIVAGRGFTPLSSVAALEPGDWIAVKYLQRSDNTGHLMMVAQPPQRVPDSEPLLAGSQQWTVAVIDSSESAHGPGDSRYRKGAGGHDHDGLGQGVIRLYSDTDGRVLAFTWSTRAQSVLKTPDSEPVALGRLQANFRP